ncbi:MAG: FAD-dependent oxidoreductase, partial [Alphaproteobacteria bacterium]
MFCSREIAGTPVSSAWRRAGNLDRVAFLGRREMDDTYDVVIVGGGAMGSATAFFLATSDAFDGKVLVVERDSTYDTAATPRSLGG